MSESLQRINCSLILSAYRVCSRVNLQPSISILCEKGECRENLEMASMRVGRLMLILISSILSLSPFVSRPIPILYQYQIEIESGTGQALVNLVSEVSRALEIPSSREIDTDTDIIVASTLSSSLIAYQIEIEAV